MTKLIIYSFLILFCIFNKAVAEPYAQLMAYYPNGENIMDRHPQMILDDDFNVHIAFIRDRKDAPVQELAVASFSIDDFMSPEDPIAIDQLSYIEKKTQSVIGGSYRRVRKEKFIVAYHRWDHSSIGRIFYARNGKIKMAKTFSNSFTANAFFPPPSLVDSAQSNISLDVSTNGDVIFCSSLTGKGDLYSGKADNILSNKQSYSATKNRSDLSQFFTRLTSDPSLESQPSWSQSGDKLAYIALEGNGVVLRLADFQNGRLQNDNILVKTEGSVANPVWSSDGKYISYYNIYNSTNDAGKVEKNTDLFIINVSNSEITKISKNVGRNEFYGSSFLSGTHQIIYSGLENGQIKIYNADSKQTHIMSIKNENGNKLRLIRDMTTLAGEMIFGLSAYNDENMFRIYIYQIVQ